MRVAEVCLVENRQKRRKTMKGILLFTLHCLLLLALLMQSPSSWEVVSVRLSERAGSCHSFPYEEEVPFHENGKQAVPLELFFSFAGSRRRCIIGQVS